METISGADAIQRMRNLKYTDSSFHILFITCDLNRQVFGEKRKHEGCRLRAARRNEGLKVNPDHYLFFKTADGEPRQCFKKLIRFVWFPPDYRCMKVNWFM